MEADFVRWLQEQNGSHGRSPLGFTDDAAWLRDPANASLVVTTDMLCEGVHFEVQQTPWEWIGRKALAVNLSDLAAMAARPRAAFVSFAWPQAYDPLLARRLYQGLFDLASDYDVTLAGGDTNRWQGGLVINVTLLGQATERGVLTRSGARPGDVILVTGPLGGSLLGHHLHFQPRVALALQLHATYSLHAGMDISDGLSLDLDRLARASGVGAWLDLPAVPVSDAAHRMSATSGRSPLEHALSDGEDFELLLIAPQADADLMLRNDSWQGQLTRVGQIVEEPGLWCNDAHGRRVALAVEGYLH